MEVTNYLLTGMILQVPRKSDELATIKRKPTSYNKRGSLASSGVDSMDIQHPHMSVYPRQQKMRDFFPVQPKDKYLSIA